MSERGIYSVTEGSDGTGKSAQVNLQAEYLESIGRHPLRVFNDETGRMEPIQEPGGTPLANKIRAKIKDVSIARTPWQNVVWFTDARVSIFEDAILPALERGDDVPTARNFVSTIAYQGYGEGIPIAEIMEYTRERVGEAYMSPDVLCILALRNERVRQDRIAKAARKIRADKDTFESMPPEFQQSMQNGYVRYAEANGIEIIDADQSVENVQADILKYIKPLL